MSSAPSSSTAVGPSTSALPPIDERPTKLSWVEMSMEEDSFGKDPESPQRGARSERPEPAKPSKVCWADFGSDDSFSMPVPPINRRTVVRGNTTFPKAAPLDAQDSYLEPPTDASKLAVGVAGLTTAPEESRPAGFGFLMNNTRIVIPEDSKGSVTGGELFSNLPGQLEDSKRPAAKRLSSASANGDLETASKFRRLNSGFRDMAKGPSFFPDPNADVKLDPIFGGDHPVRAEEAATEDGGKTPRTEQRRRRPVLRARRRTTGGAAAKTPLSEAPATEEQWRARAEQRAKQIEIGKMTENYLAYRTAVTPRKRNPTVDPITPDPNERVSKRAFDAELKQWRKKLHSVEASPRQQGVRWYCVTCDKWYPAGVSTCASCGSGPPKERIRCRGCKRMLEFIISRPPAMLVACQACKVFTPVNGKRSKDGVIDPTRQSIRSADDAATVARARLSFIIETCLNLNQSFVDDEFPPSSLSLFKHGHQGATTTTNVHSRWGEVAALPWLRPGPGYTLFDPATGPVPEDVLQGSLGDCWMLSALAALCQQRPSLVKDLFPYQDGTERSAVAGVYMVRLCDSNGAWRLVVVDDHFLSTAPGRRVFAGKDSGVLWVSLLEKAYAKLSGSYEAIEAGTASEGLTMLTGWPCISYHLQPGRPGTNEGREVTQVDDDVLWGSLVSHAGVHIMCASCGFVDGVGKEEYEAMGLFSEHCYTILKVVALDGLRLLKLRNPWGSRVWRGPYGPSSDEWTPELQSQLQSATQEPPTGQGIFWISLADLRRYFCSVTVCLHEDSWSEARTPTMPFPSVLSHPAVPAAEISSFANSQANLAVFQSSDRSADNSAFPNDIGIVLFRRRPGANSNVLDYVASSPRSTQSTVQLDTWLYSHTQEETNDVETRFLAVILTFNHRAGSIARRRREFTLGVFSAKPVIVRDLWMGFAMERTALAAHIAATGSCQINHGFYLYTTYDAGYSVYVVNTSNRAVYFEATVANAVNLSSSRGWTSNSDGSNVVINTHDLILPGQAMIVLIVSDWGGGFRYMHNYRYTFMQRWSANQVFHTPPIEEESIHQPFACGPNSSQPLIRYL
ncbi:hypothetical protein FOL46_001649 [Perkinsus olseni]|uniref:Calpain catalytic domain-containing protein n=1 Tax=Perkinsus olseni TaxID=32597 RepID=A0A7J6MD22_PEROL|nr:hypothetical protein FOL46_001649 [Perkinsus olseni]